MPHRCANPLRSIGVKGHVGKNLRFLSANLRKKYPFLPKDAKICDCCRKKISNIPEIPHPGYEHPAEALSDVPDNSYESEEPKVKRFRSSSPSTSQQTIPRDVSSNRPDNRSENKARCRTESASSIFSVNSHSEVTNDTSNESTELKENEARNQITSPTLLTFTSSLSMQDASDSSSDSWVQSDSENTQSQISNMPVSSREADLETMLDGLKEKFKDPSTSHSDRVRILTIAPKSWNAGKIASEFGATRHMATKAQRLRDSKGVLASPVQRSGKKLPDKTVQTVRDFYENDMNSRLLPGVKDVISLKIDGIKQHFQKRLILCNLTELFQAYKTAHPELIVGFSKFAELRPKHCILAGASGTHSVCVCTYHQNCKLMLDAINIGGLTQSWAHPIQNYKDCLNAMMCVNPSPACHFNECKDCPGVQTFGQDMIKLLNNEMIDEVEFRVWQSTDRTTLQTMKASTVDFINDLSNRLMALKPHDFVAKQQSAFCAHVKGNLAEGEFLVQCDFSENYAYVVQDAAQSFHYNNDQCTVHPIVYYYREAEEVRHRSLVLLSDSLLHDTSAVYVMQEMLIENMKRVHKNVSKIIYFTDGAAQHYKNRYQMANLLNHEEDFGVMAEWHFHATAHGKSACDGIGALLKRGAARTSLQITSGEPIATPEALFRWAKKNLHSTEVLFYGKERHDAAKKNLQQRFATAKAIPGIQKSHGFIPNPDKTLLIKRYSASTEGKIIKKLK